MAKLRKISTVNFLLLLIPFLFSNVSFAAETDGPCDPVYGNMEYPKPEDLPAGTVFWGYYQCSACGNEASMKPVDGEVVCNTCGAPHTDEAYYMTRRGSNTINVSQIADEENIDEARSGKKIDCPYCGASQFANQEGCSRCGGQPDGTYIDTRYDNESLARFEQDQTKSNPKIRTRTKVIMWAAGAIIATATTLGISWGLKKTEITGTIESAGYKHTIALERFEETTRSDWASNVRESHPVMPVEGSGERSGQYDIRNRREEIHHYEKVFDHYETETYQEQVPYTDYETEIVDNGNGSFESKQVPVTRYRSETRTRQVPVYRNEPVYRIKVDYDTYLWFEKYRRHISGNLPHPDDQVLPWPVIKPGELDRLKYYSDYKVVVSYELDGELKKYEVTPSTESEFREWQPGDKRIIVRNNFGRIFEVKPVEE